MAARALFPKLSESFRRIVPSENVRRVVPAVVFSAVFGGVAIAMMQRWHAQQTQILEHQRAQLMQNYQEPIQVVAAAADIPTGTKLEAAQLTTASVPKRFVQPYTVYDPSEVVGMVTVAPLATGEHVLKNKLRRPEEVVHERTLSNITPAGKRAATIVVDAVTGVGGFVRPRDRVDVLWSFNASQPDKHDGEMVTITLFQDVPVLAVGGDMSGAAAQEGAEQQQSNGQRTVTLALAPPDMSVLLFARDHGRMQLSLRPTKETGQVPVPPASMESVQQRILAELGLPTQAPAARPPRQIEVYKGLKRDVVVLPETN